MKDCTRCECGRCARVRELLVKVLIDLRRNGTFGLSDLVALNERILR